jgi:hypothetical protein
MRYLSTFAIGEKVRYYTDTGGSWMDRITAHTDIATVVSKSSNGVDVCLGWKAGERFLLGPIKPAILIRDGQPRSVLSIGSSGYRVLDVPKRWEAMSYLLPRIPSPPLPRCKAPMG